MANIHLTLATNDYDHVRDITMGIVRPDGIDLTVLTMEVEEIFHRFLFSLEWDVSEISTGMSTSWISRGGAPFVLIPVFPSRVFRFSSIYIPTDGKVKKAADLRGKRIGVPEWGQTAGIYTRGWMVHEAGIPLTDVTWVQSGINDPGRQEAAKLDLPPGVKLEVVTDRSLTRMMLDGDLDAAFKANAGFQARLLATASPLLAGLIGEGKLKIAAKDTLLGDNVIFEADLVVLATGLVPVTKDEPVLNLGYRQGQFPNAEAASREVLALPIYPELTDHHQEAVADSIARFFTALA